MLYTDTKIKELNATVGSLYMDIFLNIMESYEHAKDYNILALMLDPCYNDLSQRRTIWIGTRHLIGIQIGDLYDKSILITISFV